MQEEVIHKRYLPFTREQLLGHFAPVARGGERERHLRYYLASAEAAARLAQLKIEGAVGDIARAAPLGRQMEKDERFWIATAMLSIFHSPRRIEVLTGLLTRCLGEVPPMEGLSSWAEALGTEQRLYFEVNLPSPESYRVWLAEHLDERVLIPYVRQAAARRLSQRLEGATKVDAMLLAPSTGLAVLFEAKVLSDVSGGIEFDVLRNQLVRNVDVMLEENPGLQEPLPRRRPERSCLVLVTPEVFRIHRHGRLYGWLFDAYKRDPGKLQEHLPHRHDIDFRKVADRLGWLSWEDCNEVLPGSCQWLPAPEKRAARYFRVESGDA